MSHEAYDQSQYDADGDGAPEFCFEVGDHAGMILQATKLDSTQVWIISLNKMEVCSSCGEMWQWSLVSFGDTDLSPGREAILRWDDNGTGQEGVVVVSINTNEILESFPGARCRLVFDHDGDGSDEIILQYGDYPPPCIYEIWGQSSGSGIDDEKSGGNSARSFAAIHASPNPTLGGATLELDLARDAGLDITVVDIEGRVVKNLDHREFHRGNHRIQWDGTDHGGRDILPGVYYITVREGSAILCRSVVRMD